MFSGTRAAFSRGLGALPPAAPSNLHEDSAPESACNPIRRPEATGPPCPGPHYSGPAPCGPRQITVSYLHLTQIWHVLVVEFTREVNYCLSCSNQDEGSILLPPQLGHHSDETGALPLPSEVCLPTLSTSLGTTSRPFVATGFLTSGLPWGPSIAFPLPPVLDLQPEEAGAMGNPPPPEREPHSLPPTDCLVIHPAGTGILDRNPHE